jgi:hypothetical protein
VNSDRSSCTWSSCPAKEQINRGNRVSLASHQVNRQQVDDRMRTDPIDHRLCNKRDLSSRYREQSSVHKINTIARRTSTDEVIDYSLRSIPFERTYRFVRTTRHVSMCHTTLTRSLCAPFEMMICIRNKLHERTVRLYSSVVERQSCKLEVRSSILRGGIRLPLFLSV